MQAEKDHILENLRELDDEDRLSANPLHGSFEQEIENAEAELLGGPPSLEQSQQPYGLQIMSEPGSLLSMQEAHEYRKARKSGLKTDPKVERVIQDALGNLKDRDYLFFIDDTDSMKEHSAQVQECFQTLAYIVKAIDPDPDSLGLSFVSKPLPIIRDKNSGPFVRRLVQHLNDYVSVRGRIEDSLSTLVTEVVIKRLPFSLPFVGHVPRSRPITVFVFTDGKWGHEVPIGNGLDTPISNLVREMKNRGLNRTHVMFQFLRFGDDEKGREHLLYLDNLGQKENWSVRHAFLFL